MFKDVSIKSCIALVLFLFGKMTSLPVVYFILTGEKEGVFWLMTLYISLILSSILLSLSEIIVLKRNRTENE